MNFDNMSKDQYLGLLKDNFGIFFEGAVPMVTDSDRSFKDNALKLVGDVDTYTYNPASNGVPAWYTLVNINTVVEQLLPVRRYSLIGEPLQYGNFTTNIAQFGEVGFSGQIEAYDDFSGTQKSDFNATWPTRDVYRGQTFIEYGDLEVATMAEAKIDAVSRKQRSAAFQIAIAQNKLFFFGNINSVGAFLSRTYGILNDPQLNAATPATNGTSGSPLWSVKAANVATGANDIANDVIVTAMTVMQSQMGGNVDQMSKFKLCVPTVAISYMNAQNSFGLSATKIIKDTLPNIEIISTPEYQSINSFQLIGPTVDIENVAKDLFTYKVRGHTLVPQVSSKRQKWSFGSSGCALLQTAPVVTISGITA
jgi:hypothetical protein